MSDETPIAPSKCTALVEGRAWCRKPATAVLQYDSNGFTDEGLLKPWSDRRTYDYPLCSQHEAPSFHLRDVESPNWRIVPVYSGSSSREDDR